MINIKVLAVATAISAGVAFAMPVASQAMPVAPVKVQTANDSNVVDVHYKKRSKKWARYCRRYPGDWRCHRRQARVYRYRYYDPYYSDPYYNDYYYGDYYRPRFYSPGIGFRFRID